MPGPTYYCSMFFVCESTHRQTTARPACMHGCPTLAALNKQYFSMKQNNCENKRDIVEFSLKAVKLRKQLL